MDKQPPPTYDWKVRAKDPKRDVPNIRAAYFGDSGDFIAFKDSDHKTVYMIARDQVLDVGRVNPNLPPAIIKASANMVGEGTLAQFKSELPKP